MNSLVFLIISLSLSASIIAGLLFAFRPLYRDCLSKSWQYYIWLVVMLRLLVPLAPETNLMGTVFSAVQQAHTTTAPASLEYAPPAATEPNPGVDEANTGKPAAVMPANPSGIINTVQLDVAASQSSPWQQFANNLWLLWFIPALVLFVRSVTSYNSFLRYIKAGREEIRDETVMTAYHRACEDTGMRKPLPVYQNKLASSPMLVGVFRPSIILPKLDMDVEGMQLVLRHELVHHRRRDLFYKWLVQLAVCVHWFNPLVYLVSKEIGKNCELSCDERVVAKMAAGEKSHYGDTLLASIKTGGTYSSVVASVTLSEDGKNLKERLSSIMKFRPRTRSTKAVAAACSLLLIWGASFAGAYIGFAAAADHTLPALGELPDLTESPATNDSPNGYVPSSLDEYVSDRISKALEDSLDPDTIEAWAKGWAESWSEEQTEYWKNYAEQWSQYPTEYWNNYADQWRGYWDNAYTSPHAQDSWMKLSYEYEDGYLVGVGVKHNDSLDNYQRTETLTANGRTCTVAFAAGYESWADDAKAMALVQEILTGNTHGTWENAEYYVMRSAYYSTDREELLRQLYDARAFVEFMELVEHCSGLDVIEELLYAAADDRESMYFMFLAEQLPADFSGGEALARKAVEMGDIIMLDEMERFIPSSLYDSLMSELLQLPEFS